MPASRSCEGQGKGVVGGGPEPARQAEATGRPGAETPVYNDFFKTSLTVYKPTVQAHSPQEPVRGTASGSGKKNSRSP